MVVWEGALGSRIALVCGVGDSRVSQCGPGVGISGTACSTWNMVEDDTTVPRGTSESTLEHCFTWNSSRFCVTLKQFPIWEALKNPPFIRTFKTKVFHRCAVFAHFACASCMSRKPLL